MSQDKILISALMIAFVVLCPLHVNMAHGADGVSYEALSKVANDINKTLPRMINNNTKFETLVPTKNMLTYKYVLVNELSYGANAITAKDIQDELATQTRTGVCSHPSTHNLLKRGVTMVYSYFSGDGVYITEIPIRLSDCH